MYLFHLWNNQAGSSTAEPGGPGVYSVVSAIKPVKRVRLEEPLEITANLNLSDYYLQENVEGEQEKAEDVAPDLVLLSSSSSKDKTQEERLEDISSVVGLSRAHDKGAVFLVPIYSKEA